MSAFVFSISTLYEGYTRVGLVGYNMNQRQRYTITGFKLTDDDNKNIYVYGSNYESSNVTLVPELYVLYIKNR